MEKHRLDPELKGAKFIKEGGSGGEATVNIELRNEFPGLGGIIHTRDGVITALRREKQTSPKAGHRAFLRHMIAKKLEDHFYRKGDAYTFSHIPRPLGSISREGDKPYEAYIYQWVMGSENFPWYTRNMEHGRDAIELEDWNSFVSKFGFAGIDVGYDVTEDDDGDISKNIIHMFPDNYIQSLSLPPTWKRIDFGERSIAFDFEKLKRFIGDNRSSLIETLRFNRYEMIRLGIRYLEDRGHMNPRDIGRLEAYVGSYRGSSLSHYLKGLVPADKSPVFEEGNEHL